LRVTFDPTACHFGHAFPAQRNCIPDLDQVASARRCYINCVFKVERGLPTIYTQNVCFHGASYLFCEVRN